MQLRRAVWCAQVLIVVGCQPASVGGVSTPDPTDALFTDDGTTLAECLS